MADPEPQTAPNQAPSIMNTLEDLAPGFARLLSLMEDHNKMMADQGKTQAEQTQILRNQTKMLEALQKDATRDDKAYEGRGLRDEATWGSLDQEALAKMKVIVDGWKDLMNVSLIFIALFLTVVTAFISPIIQLFSTPSSTKSKPALPPTSLQLVALFYSLALMFSICNSVMCVLGLQWAGRLLSTPLGRTNLERALNRERRKVLAQQRLLPLMGVLFWTLLLSIAFFVIGFLVQFWALSFSFDERAPILIIGAVVATALALTILGVILATTYHATVHENSPFESPLSSASIAISAWLARMTQKSKKKSAKGRGWYQSSLIISHLNGLRGRIQHFARRISHWINPSLSLESSSNESSEDAEESCNETVSEEDGVKEEPIEALTKENEEDDATVQALKAYARLVLNTNDAEVLERAVPSFEIGQWYSAGVELWDLFLAVRERFLATDTSFRVKETVTQQLVYFMQWSGWRNGYTWRDDLEGNAITRWCTDQCKNLVDRSHESHRQFFFTFVFLTSLDPHNSDLRGSPYDSYERTVARVLCSFDRGGELILGFRENVFSSAVQECRPLLRDAKSDDVTRILSIGDRSSIIRSLLRNPHISWDYIGEMVALITRGNEVAILEELAEFFCNVPDMKPVGIFSRDLLVIDFLGSLIPSLPPRFTLPRSFDLTPTLSLLLRYQSKVKSLERYIDTLLYFLDHDGFEQLSSLRPAHDFFRLCLTRSSNHQLDKNVSDRARFYLSEHHGAFTPLPRPSDQDFEEFGDAILAYARDVTSQELEENFIDTIMGCDCLIREQALSEVKNILSPADHLLILRVLVRNRRLRVSRISSLVALAMERQENTYLRDLIPFITNQSLQDYPDAYQPIIEFLTLILQHIHSDFTVPPQFDLSLVFRLFIRNRPDRDTWREFSDTLMQYLDHGAFDACSDKETMRHFLDLCVESYNPGHPIWERKQQTSESTRQQAAKLLKKLDGLDAGQSSESVLSTDAAISPQPMKTEAEDQPWPLTLRILHSITQMLRNTWTWKRKTGVHVAVEDPDIEMGSRSCSQA